MADRQAKVLSPDGNIIGYIMSEPMQKRIENDFMYHPAKPGQVERYQAVRDGFKNLAILMATSCPESRELSAAFTLLEQAGFEANASIARNE